VRRVPRPNPLLLAALREFPERVLADRLEHPVARLAARAGPRPDERLLHQPPERPEQIPVAVLPVGAQGLRRPQREAAREHGQAPEQHPLLFGEEVVAPAQGRLHRPLPFGQVPRPAGLEDPVQHREQFRGPQESRLRGGELQRERQSLEAPADRRHRGGVLAGEPEGGGGRPGALEEEPGGGCGVHGPDVRGAGGVGHRKRRHGALPLAPQAKRGAARDEQDEARAGAEQPGQLGSRAHHVLEVVQHEQQFPPSQVRPQRLVGRPAAGLPKPQGPADGGSDEARVTQRRQRGEGRAVREGPAGPGGPDGDLEGQAGLPHAARPREREQPCPAPAEDAERGLRLPLAPYERGRRHRQGGAARGRPVGGTRGAPRPGTDARSGARSASPSPSASARALTVCG
jgi:hypothetical protein